MVFFAYLSPAALEYWGVVGEHIPKTINFAVGLFALAIVREIFKGKRVQIDPVSADLPDRPKAPRPEVMDKELPPPLFFQSNLQTAFDKLLPSPTK